MPLLEDVVNSPRYTREPLHYFLLTLKVSHISNYKKKHNASLIQSVHHSFRKDAAKVLLFFDIGKYQLLNRQ